MLKRLEIYPNAYYSYLKDRKKQYRLKKQKVQFRILDIYHENGGTPGYRQVRDYLALEGINYSALTIHNYMREMHLYSITRKKNPYKNPGGESIIYPNLLNQKFKAKVKNKIWLVDFTYVFTKEHKVVYNCSIIDVYDRFVVATLNSTRMDTKLAINTLKMALERNKTSGYIILHSDQGSQFASREFGEFCKKNHVQQSMSRAGCPYDNAPMERFFNTLKCEFVYSHAFNNYDDLNKKIINFVKHYNYKRPHTFNNGMTPSMKRTA